MHFCGIKSYCSNGLMCKTLLKREILIGIQERQIHGFKGIRLLHRETNHEVELIAIMRSALLDAVREFGWQAGRVSATRRLVIAW
jgi:hypothetical protein